MSQFKILLFGQIGDESVAFLSKLRALNSSKAGPFDAAFCVGAVNVTNLLKALNGSELPTRVFLQESLESTQMLVNLQSEHSEGEKKHNGDDDVEASNEKASLSTTLLEVTKNLFVLRNKARPHNVAVWSLPVSDKQKGEMVVAACPSHLRSDSAAAKELMKNITHVSYRGCDLLLSTEWPQGVESLLPNKDENGVPANISFDIADIALKARARYHVAVSGADDRFVQTAAFRHLAATTNTVSIKHTGRFLALGSVCDAAKLKERGGNKATKFVHALKLKPLSQMSAMDLNVTEAATALPCPFTDSSYEKDDSGNDRNRAPQRNGEGVGLSEASARRILAEQGSAGGGAAIGAQRWATTNKKKEQSSEPTEIDPNCKTLFIHGLHKDVTGSLQSTRGDALLLEAFQSYKALQIRKPPNAATSSFAFVDFPSHEHALTCWTDFKANGIDVNGVHLDVKWANQKRKRDNNDPEHPSKRTRLMEADARDSSTVYYKLPMGMEGDRDKIGESLRSWCEKTLEDALAPEGDDGERITAADEPALRVQREAQDESKKDSEDVINYGFLEFASHAAASMALATLTGSTDGGLVLPDAPRLPSKEYGQIRLHWGHGKKQNEKNLIEDASGFKFERKHFPADSRKDCWFCLASESCERHLITGVYDRCYSAMPKGPVHPGHVLLVPVQHTDQGALKDTHVADEMDSLKAKICEHAASKYDMDMFVFERAIKTKGGYHTHVQCIPVARQLGIKLKATMMAQARKLGINIREITSDLAITALVANDEDETGTDGYFYAEIYMEGRPKRFLYKSSSDGPLVPLQFGREILAAVLGQPDVAHWKSCVKSKEEETELASTLRASLAKAFDS